MNDEHPSVPYGFCHCGCGLKTKISTYNSTFHGYVKGKSRRYVRGHGSRTHEADRYRVEDCGYETPCWVCLLWKDKDGYGRIWHKGRNTPAHRVAWEKANGPIPEGLVIDHLCRNPSCVNPDHMEVVTAAENRRRSHDVRLTMKMAREIRQAKKDGATLQELSDRYGVCPSGISAVVVGKNWRES